MFTPKSIHPGTVPQLAPAACTVPSVLGTGDTAPADTVGTTVAIKMPRRKRKPRKQWVSRIPPMNAAHPFSMVNWNGLGGKIRRCYEFNYNAANTAAVNSGIALGFSVKNVGGTLSLNVYGGVPTTGTLVSSEANFPTEAGHYFDIFRWMKVERLEFIACPIVHAITESVLSTTDASVQGDNGQVYLLPWDGDGDYANATTGAWIFRDEIDAERLPHVKMTPAGGHAKVMTLHSNTVEVRDLAQGFDDDFYPRTRAIDTAKFMAANAEYPFYGGGYYWSHENLALNAGKIFFRLKIRVEICWNTVKDTSVSSFSMADTLNHVLSSLPGTKLPIQHAQGPPVLYPSVIPELVAAREVLKNVE